MHYARNPHTSVFLPKPFDVVFCVLCFFMTHCIGKSGCVVWQVGAIIDGEPLAGPQAVGFGSGRVDEVFRDVVQIASPVRRRLGLRSAEKGDVSPSAGFWTRFKVDSRL